LTEDEAIINRFGFNSAGYDVVERRLRRRKNRSGIVGVNLGANKDSVDKICDYVTGVRRFSPLAHYLTINISSPNTPGLRDLQAKVALIELVKALVAVRDEVSGPPLFLKVSPDLDLEEIADIASVAMSEKVDAIIIGNTTTSRPTTLKSEYAREQGGLSGAPLKPLALHALCSFREAVGSAIPLVAAGGIASAEDAYERIKAGASLVQLYTALAYKGPGLATEIESGLLRLMEADGYANISEAIGADASKQHARHANQGGIKSSNLQVA
jgi:dihydroorotate dehydrogenase